MEIQDLKIKAAQIRQDLLTIIHRAKTGHTGGSLSNTDILTALYYEIMNIDVANPKWEERDRFVASKGHSVESLWCILADRGFFPKEELKTYSQFGTRLIGHPNNKVPGIEMNTGALGHGLPISVGMALAAKRDGRSYRVFCLMGDGEQAEGSNWEAAMAGAHYKLDNLVGIIDRNGLQISGTTEEVMGLEPLEEKWAAFGWNVISIDGNSMEELVQTFRNVPEIEGKPTLVLANTIKGKGVSFAEGVPGWHHHVPNDEELERGLTELQQKIDELSGEGQVK
ncbi:transketolase [Paenibacillus kribbensis]|uniref:Transketolase n=1 Tax=Paenibacillus kribbensis TaxID=172713 RepID=A0A222WJ69_9BACL|nr:MULTISPECIES: transketolase [Paenibacillus]ASR45821.1 transketolase [Paenibacillus kribbensis]EHS55901.1 transketolase domain-containing protein [Paenibacillus sp. Aloe-11]MEC0235590.1 transketolase [Paenibacillus kribbensis]